MKPGTARRVGVSRDVGRTKTRIRVASPFVIWTTIKGRLIPQGLGAWHLDVFDRPAPKQASKGKKWYE